jgi:phytol kinase
VWKMFDSNLWGTIILVAYYIGAASGIALLDHLTFGEREWIRKGYHLLYSFSIFIYMYLFKDWYISLIALIVITLIAILVLKIAERIPLLMKLSISRSSAAREVILQMLYIHCVFIVFIVVFQFLWKQPVYHAVVGTIIWGFGDAAAALSGKYFGKNHYFIPLFSSKKTLEGSTGFIIISFIPCFILLYFASPYNLLSTLLVTAILVFAASIIEALSRKGLDTITIPLLVSLASVFLERLF